MSDHPIIMFEIAATNPYTKATARFLAQGTTLLEALDDAKKVISTPWKPKANGKAYPPLPLNVTLPDGKHVAMTIKEFSAKPAPADDEIAL